MRTQIISVIQACFKMFKWAVVVAQLAEWSLPIREFCGSKRVVRKKIIMNIFTVKKKEAGNGICGGEL